MTTGRINQVARDVCSVVRAMPLFFREHKAHKHPDTRLKLPWRMFVTLERQPCFLQQGKSAPKAHIALRAKHPQNELAGIINEHLSAHFMNKLAVPPFI